MGNKKTATSEPPIMSETAIQHHIRFALNRTGMVRVVRNSVGFDSAHRLRYGMGVGSPDLLGILRDGRAFGIEVKRPRESVRREQAAWWVVFRRWGGTGGVATSVEQALELLECAIRKGVASNVESE